jgi:hypothetical protein
VPERRSGGLTLNAGNPLGVLMMVGTIVPVAGLGRLDLLRIHNSS